MAGRLIEFDAGGTSAPGYLAKPDAAAGPGIVVLHAWWGLTEPIRQACDRLAAAGFVALAPDLYRGKTATTIEEAGALASALDQQVERVRGDIQGAMRVLRQHADDARGGLAVVGFSLGAAYALDISVELAEEIAAVVIFYGTYTGLEFNRAKAAYLLHFAEHDPYEPAESAAQMEQELKAAGRPVSAYTYPGTTHWFFEANRPDAYNAAAAALAWERTIAFLNADCDDSIARGGAHMEALWRTTLWKQFGAAIDMLDNALLACPSALWQERLWSDRSDHPASSHFDAFWSLAHHTLFWLDFYLSGSLEGFTPLTPFTVDEQGAPERIPPEQPYTREELHGYLVQLRQKCHTTLLSLSDEQARVQAVFPWLGEEPMRFWEIQLLTMRHVQEHAAQLSLFLGQHAVPDEAID